MQKFPFALCALILMCLWSALSNAQSSSAVYFKGSGSNPGWNLDISEDNVIFNSVDSAFARFVVKHIEPVKVKSSGIRTYNLECAEVTMEITVTEQMCQSPSGRERFPFAVTVSLLKKGESVPKIFSGCGFYVPDHRLQGNWYIEKVKTDTIPAFLFAERAPFLELGADASYFTGFAGCNKISGRLYFERGLMRFTDFVVPKETCEKISFEKNIIDALHFTTQFKFLGDKLVLSNPSYTTMVLRREK